VAVFAGPNATVLNSTPLITSDQGRARAGLPPRADAYGEPGRFDILRPQRLAQPATVWVEQFSAHPLEADASDLYGPPDGWLGVDGEIRPERTADADVPVLRIELRPEDGLLALPYVSRQRDGSAWEGDGVTPDSAAARQPFYPDASRVFEEIDRFGIDEDGHNNLLSRYARFDFYRAVPSGGYTRGLTEAERTHVGDGDVPAEVRNRDFFAYRPGHLRGEPARRHLATITNAVAAATATGEYEAVMWLEGSPSIEETLYWLNLVIDTERPILGVSSTEWPHGAIGAGGDRNLIQAMRYFDSRIWADERGRDLLGGVLIDAERVFIARDVQKADARPGGYIATGGHGGIVATLGDPGRPRLTNVPVWRHTSTSEVRLPVLQKRIHVAHGTIAAPVTSPLTARLPDGSLSEDGIPHVSIVKHARFLASSEASDADAEVEVMARLQANLAAGVPGGFVVESNTPYGSSSLSIDAAMRLATLCGHPVVRVGRGNPEGWVPEERMRLAVAGANLTSTKARLLLMACILRFGPPPPAMDPTAPTEGELARIQRVLDQYQRVFDTH
jgi:hypothetical protein